MLNPPNGLSFLRAPLALLFFVENTTLRIVVILLAMLSDSIDGYLARRFSSTSKFGAILDPIMDKFFVYVTLGILLAESQISAWQVSTMLSRDFFLLLFMTTLFFKGTWKSLQYKSIRWGKVTTASQFLILLGIVLKLPIPNLLYFSFVLFGVLAFFELIADSKNRALSAQKNS